MRETGCATDVVPITSFSCRFVTSCPLCLSACRQNSSTGDPPKKDSPREKILMRFRGNRWKKSVWPRPLPGCRSVLAFPPSPITLFPSPRLCFPTRGHKEPPRGYVHSSTCHPCTARSAPPNHPSTRPRSKAVIWDPGSTSFSRSSDTPLASSCATVEGPSSARIGSRIERRKSPRGSWRSARGSLGTACSKRRSHRPKCRPRGRRILQESGHGFGVRVQNLPFRAVHRRGLTFLLELLGRNIRLASAQPFTQMRLLLPTHPKHVGNTKVGDLTAGSPVNLERDS